MFSLDQYRALHEGAGLVDRSDRGRLMLTGADRRAYLQGLLTNDIVALTPGTGCYAAYLTAQGRMIADLRLFEIGDALMVDLDGSLAEPVRARWTQFIFSEDVEIQDLSATTAQLGVYGARAADVIAAALATLDSRGPGPEPRVPTAKLLEAMALYGNGRWLVQGGSVVVLRSDDVGVPGFDVIIPVNLKEQLVTLLQDAGAVEVGPETAEVSRVEAGRPLFLADMDTDTIPLEAGIEDRAISLTKGCYVGQEIIIRVLHRGHGRVARRLVGVAFDPSAAVPARGERLRAGEREVGTITSAVASPALGRPIALASVHRDFVEPGTVLDTSAGSAVVATLPFVRESA
ncbi:MAG: glycine cleavage T C-terminal barrel domain-containing protein [Acidobacteriota bacterium]